MKWASMKEISWSPYGPYARAPSKSHVRSFTSANQGLACRNWLIVCARVFGQCGGHGSDVPPDLRYAFRTAAVHPRGQRGSSHRGCELLRLGVAELKCA